jgi:hypothetical protein
MRMLRDDQRRAMFANMGNRFSCGSKCTLVSNDFNKFSVKSDIKGLIDGGGFKMNPYASAYYNSLDDSEALGGDEGVRAQALYLASNLTSENQMQDEILDQLVAIGYNKTYTKKPSVSVGLDMDEIQYERLVDAFTEYSEDLFGADRKLGIDAFKSFADKRGIPLEKALVANPWVEESLTPEAAVAVKDAWTKVKIKGLNA